MTDYTTYPNITDLNFSDSPLATIFEYGNTVTGEMVAPLFLFLIGATVFLATYRPGRGKRAFMVCGFVSMMVSFAMLGFGWLHPFWFFTCTILTLAGGYLVSTENPY